MNFDFARITNLNIKFDKNGWNPKTHNIIIECDPEGELKFKVNMVAIEPPVLDVTQAADLLKKFGIKKHE